MWDLDIVFRIYSAEHFLSPCQGNHSLEKAKFLGCFLPIQTKNRNKMKGGNGEENVRGDREKTLLGNSFALFLPYVILGHNSFAWPIYLSCVVSVVWYGTPLVAIFLRSDSWTWLGWRSPFQVDNGRQKLLLNQWCWFPKTEMPLMTLLFVVSLTVPTSKSACETAE